MIPIWVKIFIISVMSHLVGFAMMRWDIRLHGFRNHGPLALVAGPVMLLSAALAFFSAIMCIVRYL